MYGLSFLISSEREAFIRDKYAGKKFFGEPAASSPTASSSRSSAAVAAAPEVEDNEGVDQPGPELAMFKGMGISSPPARLPVSTALSESTSSSKFPFTAPDDSSVPSGFIRTTRLQGASPWVSKAGTPPATSGPSFSSAEREVSPRTTPAVVREKSASLSSMTGRPGATMPSRMLVIRQILIRIEPHPVDLLDFSITDPSSQALSAAELFELSIPSGMMLGAPTSTPILGMDPTTAPKPSLIPGMDPRAFPIAHPGASHYGASSQAFPTHTIARPLSTQMPEIFAPSLAPASGFPSVPGPSTPGFSFIAASAAHAPEPQASPFPFVQESKPISRTAPVSAPAAVGPFADLLNLAPTNLGMFSSEASVIATSASLPPAASSTSSSAFSFI